MEENLNQEKEHNQGLGAKEGWGIYIDALTNKSDEQISIIVKENGRDDTYSLKAKQRKGSYFPIPWVSKLQESWKCIIIKSDTKKDFEMAVWDDNGEKAYYNPTGANWLPAPRGKLIDGSSGHGNYELIIESDFNLSLIKIRK